MGDFRSRLFEEYRQLSDRIGKLKVFIVSDAYDSLPEIDRKDLKEQLKHMESYYHILACRVSRQCNNA